MNGMLALRTLAVLIAVTAASGTTWAQSHAYQMSDDASISGSISDSLDAPRFAVDAVEPVRFSANSVNDDDDPPSLSDAYEAGPSGCDIGSCCDAGCDSCGVCDYGCVSSCIEPMFDLHVWTSLGFTHNNRAPVNPRAGNGNQPVLFNYRDRNLQMQQTYAYLERKVDTSSCELNFGGRVDVLYGEDYFFTTAVGLETHQNGTQKWNGNLNGNGIGNTNRYGLALPQAYAEIGYNDLSVKIGHFYTTIGHESVMAAENFFYSHSYSMLFGEPFTHTGILGEWNWGDLTLFGGVHNGWNVWWREAASDMPTGMLAGFNLESAEGDIKLTAMATTGQDVDNLVVRNGVPQSFSQRTMYSVVAQLRLTCRMNLILQHDLGVQENGNGPGSNAVWYGVNSYLLYDLCDDLKAGLRYEWYNDQNGFTLAPSHFHQVTAGFNWTPLDFLRIRPEARFDWQEFHGAAGPVPIFDNTGNPMPHSSQFTAAIDAIIEF